jgi:hypothetical protein
MTKRLIVFLLLVVPLQLAWGTVSAYCEHETEPTTEHFGHHVHKHEQDSSTKTIEPSDDTKTGNFDMDCGVCHAACSVALCGGIAELNFSASGFAITPAPSFHLSLFSSKPERPKWLGLA